MRVAALLAEVELVFQLGGDGGDRRSPLRGGAPAGEGCCSFVQQVVAHPFFTAIVL